VGFARVVTDKATFAWLADSKRFMSISVPPQELYANG
jgi:hypothetical protein